MKINLNDFSIYNQGDRPIDSGLGESIQAFYEPPLGYKTTDGYGEWTVSEYAKAFFGRVLSGGLYTYRHWAMARRTGDWKEALGHRFLGALEVIPVVGSLVAVAERRFCETVSEPARDGECKLVGSDSASEGESVSKTIQWGEPVRFLAMIKLKEAGFNLTPEKFFKLFGIQYDNFDASIKAPIDSAITITQNNGVITVSDKQLSPNKDLFSIDTKGCLTFPIGKKEYVEKILKGEMQNPYLQQPADLV